MQAAVSVLLSCCGHVSVLRSAGYLRHLRRLRLSTGSCCPPPHCREGCGRGRPDPPLCQGEPRAPPPPSCLSRGSEPPRSAPTLPVAPAGHSTCQSTRVLFTLSNPTRSHAPAHCGRSSCTPTPPWRSSTTCWPPRRWAAACRREEGHGWQCSGRAEVAPAGCASRPLPPIGLPTSCLLCGKEC